MSDSSNKSDPKFRFYINRRDVEESVEVTMGKSPILSPSLYFFSNIAESDYIVAEIDVFMDVKRVDIVLVHKNPDIKDGHKVTFTYTDMIQHTPVEDARSKYKALN